MKIGVIFTGGTISSKTCGSTIVKSDSHYSLIRGSFDGIEFVTDEPYSILSEQLTGRHLTLLAQSVIRLKESCDALIITHGTDTLVYAAAFAGFVFADTSVPIFFVSSGYPLDDSRANGRENFAAAVEKAKAVSAGVYAVWSENGETVFHPAVRLLRQSPYSDRVTSLGGAVPYLPPYRAFPLPQRLCGFGRVLYLKVLPGMLYPPLTEDISAVLIECYHSGTLCTDEGFKSFMSTAKERGITVFAAGAGGRDAEYETAAEYKALGVEALPMASPDAMYIKLCLACCGGDIREQMISINCGDICE